MFHRRIEIPYDLHPIDCDCSIHDPHVPSRTQYSSALSGTALWLIAGLAFGEAIVLVLDALAIGG